MWKNSKLVLLSSALAFSITCSATSFTVSAADENSEITEPLIKEPVAVVTGNINQNFVKVKFENKVLFHEQVPTKTIIQVLNPVEEVLESEVLSGDTEMELEAPKIEAGKMLSYWSIERKNNKMTIIPILVSEKELPVNFLTTEGGELLENNAQTKEIIKSVNKGTNLKDILPEVNPKNHHKFSGWFEDVRTKNNKKVEEKIKDIDGIKITDSKGKYYAKFYPDYNDNNVDDRTEEITVKFVTNSSEKFKDIKTNVGKQMKLPILKKKDSVFMGWYTDQEYKNKFTADVLTESLTLYAKWDKADKVITQSENRPITDKDISDQVERILKDRMANQAPNNPPNANRGGNNISDLGLTVQPTQPSYEGNTSNTFKDTKYVFENKNVGQIHMVKFFDEEGGFLFSLTLPYGKTIKTYDENEQFREEYAVRHDTTIILKYERIYQ